jgi:hypothetical protein
MNENLPFELENLNLLTVSFYLNDNITLKEKSVEPIIDSTQIKFLENKKFKQSFINGIMKENNCEFKWVDENDADIIGKCNILTIDRIIESYVISKDDDDYTNDDKHWLDFKIVDQVQEEWCVGIFCGKNATNSLYFYEWDGIPYYLGLDMEGYIKMLIATRGFNLWQKALIQHRKGEATTTALPIFKENLPRLFPEVNIEEVFALYDSLYINEETVPGAV